MPRMRDNPRFLKYDLDQKLLLPESLNDWLPPEHLARFIVSVMDELDLSEIEDAYRDVGAVMYHPRMMTALWMYGYSVGIRSSRRIERATHTDVGFRYVAGNQQPDHSALAAFRSAHIEALDRLFEQVLQLCVEDGLVTLEHVATDGSKLKANASKHSAMSHGKMVEKEAKLERELKEEAELMVKKKELSEEERQAIRESVRRYFEDVARNDAEEDEKYGKDGDGWRLPEGWRTKAEQRQRIRKWREKLEERERKKAEEKGEEFKGVDAKAQINFTDPESRIMKDNATKEFVQAFNVQASVDEANQIIVARGVTQQANDVKQLEPMMEQVIENIGAVPEKGTGDAGYYSEANAKAMEELEIDAYLATGRQKHGEVPPPAPRGRIPSDLGVKERMERKLRTKAGKKAYSRRKCTVEPVFGQIKEARGIRGFLLRGLRKVTGEWSLITMTHNLLKIWRSRVAGARAG